MNDLQELLTDVTRFGDLIEINHGATMAANTNLSIARSITEDKRNELAMARAAAIAAGEVQNKDKHGANQALRDAHERDYLKSFHQAVTIAEMEEALARQKVDEATITDRYISQRLRVYEMQVKIATLIYTELEPEAENNGEEG